MIWNISRNSLPQVWCDFNAVGWSGKADDTCYYVFDTQALDRIPPSEGIRVFLFDYDNTDETEVVGCEATIELNNGRWRARPDPTTWYSGPIT